jgi:hypothetical protein
MEERDIMAIKFNREGFEYAQNRIKGNDVDTFKGSWKAHKATESEEDRFLITHDIKEYGQWFLGIDTDAPENSKERYVFPYGDLQMVHLDGVKAVEHDARSQGQEEIADAAQMLLDMIKQSTEH